jgi:hypothetical protein
MEIKGLGKEKQRAERDSMAPTYLPSDLDVKSRQPVLRLLA